MKNPPPRLPTMNDVAKRAEVSLKTVSRYVNGATNINAELRERIRCAIDELDYRHNLTAASLRPGRSSMTIGMVFGDLANPYWSNLVRAVERICSAHGYLLVTASNEENADLHDRILERMVSQRADALIVATPGYTDTPGTERAARRVPLIAFDRPADAAACSIVTDNAAGAREATALLAQHGRVGFVADSLDMWTMRERVRGFREVLPDEAAGEVVEGAHTADDAERIVTRMLLDDSVRAIFASNNRAAVGALQAFAHTGRRLPLIGFDDAELFTLVDPAVSVIAQDMPAFGRAIAAATMAVLEGEPVEDQVLAPQLVLRGSERS